MMEPSLLIFWIPLFTVWRVLFGDPNEHIPPFWHSPETGE
jgi:hypothetical protein